MLVSCFMSWNKRSQKCSIRTKSLFLSNALHPFVYIPVSEHFSFAKITHPPDRCGISRSWLNSIIITQLHFILGTIKGYSKMCRFVTQHNVTDTSVALCCVTKLHILVAFRFPSTRCTCRMIMLFSQILDMPHLSGGLSWQSRNAH